MKITIGNLFAGITTIFIFACIISLQGCASSSAQRGAAGEADVAYLETDYAFRHINDNSLSDAYQNSSQMTKGIIIGGAIGAAAGSATTGLGTIGGLGLGAIFGGAIGMYIDQHTTLADKLENRHVQVIVLGDQVLIVLPSSVVFFDHSSNIRGDAYETLDLVAQYINTLPNMSVKVAAYTSAAEPESIVNALSEQQATNVAKYLWQRNVNTRVLYAEGGGGSKLVTANVADWSTDNYRVEITLEKLPV